VKCIVCRTDLTESDPLRFYGDQPFCSSCYDERVLRLDRPARATDTATAQPQTPSGRPDDAPYIVSVPSGWRGLSGTPSPTSTAVAASTPAPTSTPTPSRTPTPTAPRSAAGCIAPNTEPTTSTKRCETCYESNASAAIKCVHCGEWLVETRISPPAAALRTVGWVWLLLSIFGGVALID